MVMETASDTVTVLAWTAIVLLIIGHHLTDLLMWNKAEDRGELSRGWRPLEDGLGTLVFVHLSIATITEMGAVTALSFAAYQNASTREGDLGEKEAQDSWTLTQVKLYLILASVFIVVSRAILSHQDVGTGTDIWDGPMRYGPWMLFQLAYAGGWILMAVCIKVDKDKDMDWMAWWGGGLIGGGGILVSALHYGRHATRYMHPAGQFFNIAGRVAHIAGGVLLAIVSMAQVTTFND